MDATKQVLRDPSDPKKGVKAKVKVLSLQAVPESCSGKDKGHPAYLTQP